MQSDESIKLKRRRSRTVTALLLGTGGVHVTLILLCNAFGLANPQWATLPVGLLLWSLAFLFAFRMPES